MDNTLPTTRIKKLELSERITEIARMLGGEEAEKTSLDHARSLLQIK
jgi:DNA repair ATPase RecN